MDMNIVCRTDMKYTIFAENSNPNTLHMLVEIQTLGDSFEQVMERVYEAASVHGSMTEDQFDEVCYADDFGSHIEITCDGGDDAESVLHAMLGDLDMSYNVSILA